MDDKLTPVQLLDGLWYKREDLNRSSVYGVNGAKYRACQHLIRRAAERGATRVVSAASVLSPQSAMAAVVSEEVGLECRIIAGATTPEKAVRHKSIAIAQLAGAEITTVKVAYNPFLQKAAAEAAASEPGNWALPYGITTPALAPLEDIRAFLEVGGEQTQNLPDDVERIVLPFGSGNTAAGVLYGLHENRPSHLREVYLYGIGPDRLNWLQKRLFDQGVPLTPEGVRLRHVPLHPMWAEYSDKMPESLDGITFHPTYEGKVVRYLNATHPAWWTERDGKTLFYIVGGPI